MENDVRVTAEVTRILTSATLDSAERARQLLPYVYDQLHLIAQQRMNAERSGHTLQATALVHEAFLKIVGHKRDLPWANRAHFFAAAAEAMRQILIDHAKRRGSLKRGGGRRRVPLSIADVAELWDIQEIMSLDDAVSRLMEYDPGIGEVVRLRFFAGLNTEQTAHALGISASTVKRRWEFGRTWLYREIKRSLNHG